MIDIDGERLRLEQKRDRGWLCSLSQLENGASFIKASLISADCAHTAHLH